MNLETESKLKFDRRMQDRHGWASEEERRAELASLPDSADKIHREEVVETPPAEAEAQRVESGDL
jgi:hypothetical protein